MPARADGVNRNLHFRAAAPEERDLGGIRVVSMSSISDGGGARRKSAILPDLLQNKSALEGDVERRATLCADVVHRNARMQFNENEAAALFHLEHA